MGQPSVFINPTSGGGTHGAGFTIRGQAQITNELNSLDKKARGFAQRRGARACAKVVAEEAKKLAPKDTGLLVKSIKVRSANKRGRIGYVVTLSEKTMGQKWYGNVQEFGAHKADGSWRIRPQKFLKNAIANKGQEGLQAGLQATWEAIQQKKSEASEST